MDDLYEVNITYKAIDPSTDDYMVETFEGIGNTYTKDLILHLFEDGEDAKVHKIPWANILTCSEPKRERERY